MNSLKLKVLLAVSLVFGSVSVFAQNVQLGPEWGENATQEQRFENAKKFRAELKCPLVYVGGLISRAGIERVLDAGFEMVQMARALVNDPAFVNKLRDGDINTRSGCDHRDYCMARMYSVDMQCCHNCKEHIPDRLWKELNKIK